MIHNMIAILDLGSTQSAQIAREIRALGVYSEIHPNDIAPAALKALPGIAGVILNGGENRVVDGRAVEVRYYVMPDYLSVGCDSDFIRVPMQPATAQKIADSFGCFLSTSKICDDVYAAAVVKLEPRPLTERREDWATFVQHDSIIESQRQGRTGLIAGIKKDVAITDSILMNPRSHRLALYGWHRLDGKPIQPVYTGHVDWYVDYSHGFRLVYRTIYVDGRPMDYVDVMHDDRLRPALTRDPWGKYLRYPTGEDEE